MPVRELREGEAVLGSVPKVRELGPDEDVLPGRSEAEQFGRGANVGIAESLGAPVDMANFALGMIGLDSDEPVGGSASIRRGMSALGLAPPPGQDDPNTPFGRVGRVVGAATSMLLPVGVAARGATDVVRGIRPAATSVAGRFLQNTAQTAVQTPARFIATETTAAVTAGAGGEAARKKFPDSPAAVAIGEVMGGLATGVVTSVAKVLPTALGIGVARRIFKSVSTSGAQRRAENRIQESARDPEAAGRNLGADTGDIPLTPTQATGDEGLLSLERSVIDSSEALKQQSDEQITQATAAIRKNISGLGDNVSPEQTAKTFEEARNYLISLLDTRMRIAARRADERIAELSPSATREDANLIAREELESARSAARAQERELFAAIPDDVTVPTSAAKDAYADALAGLSRAQQEDIPDIARRFLDPESNQALGDIDSLKELQGLRSKLLEEARKSRAAGDLNKARISNNLAEAVLEDMGAVRGELQDEAGAAVRAALDFSAELNKRFTRGPIARVLGSDRRGAPTTDPSLTLENTVGRGGPRARVETDALINAADTPALRGAVEDFLLDDFNRRAVRNGAIDAGAAERFLSRHQDVLDDFPELRQRLDSAIDAGNTAGLAQARAEGIARNLNNPKVSRAAIFLEEPVEAAMDRVFKNREPDKVMADLVRLAGRDSTGDALKGLKTAFGDFLLRRIETRDITSGGETIVSGRTLSKLLKSGPVKKMADSLLTAEERKRLDAMVDAATKIEKALAARPSTTGIIKDSPSMLFSMIARVGGAQLGREVAKKTGGGTVQTPGLFANAAKKLIEKGVNDPARRLLIDAMQDKALFETLLIDTSTPANVKRVRQKLNAWVAAIALQEIRDNDRGNKK